MGQPRLEAPPWARSLALATLTVLQTAFALGCGPTDPDGSADASDLAEGGAAAGGGHGLAGAPSHESLEGGGGMAAREDSPVERGMGGEGQGGGEACSGGGPCDLDVCPSCGTLSIFVVDIGQGDATLVLGPSIEGRRKALVVDAGNRHPDGGAIMAALLVEQGIAEVDYVVLSHFDGDHIGGFVTISGSTSMLWGSSACEPTPWFPTQGIYDQGTDTNQSASSFQWHSCVPAIASGQGTAHHPVQGGAGIGDELDLGGGYRATIVAGDGYVIGQPERVELANTPNERSIALLVSNDDGFDFLVTGDLTGRKAGAENALMETALGHALIERGVDVEVLRAGHHGAANASDPDFLFMTAPEAVIISTGNNQPSNYMHPRCATYESLAAAPVDVVLQTELGNSDCAADPPIEPIIANGTLVVEVSGSEYTIESHGAVSPANGGPTVPVLVSCTVAAGCL